MTYDHRMTRLGHVLRVCLLTATVAGHAVPASAQTVKGPVIADPTAPIEFRPDIKRTGTGVPLVNIVKPRTDGVSHNRFEKYNVETDGLVLNNSRTAGKSQLGGAVKANPNFSGSSASVILNEIRGNLRSFLEGPTEIFGDKADLIVANPNGVTCKGCNFINTDRATLTTGTPSYGANGLELTVTGGDVALEGGRISGVNALALLARQVKISAVAMAEDEISVTTGRFKQDYGTQAITPIGGDDGEAPAWAIDAAQLGALEAGRIQIIGTEAGTGVRLEGYMAATAEDLVISSSGQLVLRGGEAERDAIVTAQAAIEQKNDLWAKRRITVTAPELVMRDQASYRGAHAAVEDIILAIDNRLVLEANADASKQAEIFGGTVTITGNAQVDLDGWIYALSRTELRAASWDISADSGVTTVNADSVLLMSGNIDNSGTIFAQGALGLSGDDGQVLRNRGRIRAESLAYLATGAFINEAGGEFLSAKDMELTLAGTLDNAGTIGAEKGITGFAIAGRWNNRGVARFFQAGGDIGSLVNLTGAQWVIDDGLNVRIAGNAENAGLMSLNRQAENEGLFVAGNFTQRAGGQGLLGANIRVDAAGTNTIEAGATVNATESLVLKGANFTNVAGSTLLSAGWMEIEGVGGLTNRGMLKSGGDMALIASGATAGIANYQLAASAQGLMLKATGDIYNAEDARLWSLGDMQLTAGGQIENYRADIEALGNLRIAAASLKNHRDVEETVTCNAGGGTQNCTTQRLKGDPDTLTPDPERNIPEIISHKDMTISLTGAFTNDAGLVSADGNMAIVANSAANVAHSFEQRYQRWVKVGRKCWSKTFGLFCEDVYDWRWQGPYADGFVDSKIYAGKTLVAVIGGLAGADINIEGELVGKVGGIFSTEGIDVANVAISVAGSLTVNGDIPKGHSLFSNSGTIDAASIYAKADDFQNGQFDTNAVIGSPTQPGYDIDLFDLALARTNRVNRETGSAFDTGAGLFTVDDSNPRYKISIDMPVSPGIDQSYFLDALGATGPQPRFFADPLYEQELLRQAALRETGRSYFHSDWRTADDQHKALYDNLIAFAKKNSNLKLGQALTEAQIATLDEPLLWYVDKVVDGETVRVPKVYLSKMARENLTQFAQGRIIANDAAIVAKNRFEDRAGRIEIANDFSLKAADILFTAHQNKQTIHGDLTKTTSVTNVVSSLNVGRNANIHSAGNMVFEGTQAKIDGKAALRAEGSLALLTVIDTVETETKSFGGGFMSGLSKETVTTKTATNRGVLFDVGGSLSLESGAGDTIIQAADLRSDDSINLISESGKVRLLTATDTKEFSREKEQEGALWFSNLTEGSYDETIRYSSIQATGGLNIQGGSGIEVDYRGATEIDKSRNGKQSHQSLTQDFASVAGELSSDPATAWMQTLTTDPTVQWNSVTEKHSSWYQKTEGMSELATVLVSIAATAAMPGIGTGIAGAAMSAGASAFASQMAVGVINNKGNFSKALKQVDVKSIAVSAVTAGATEGIAGNAGKLSLSQKIKQSAAHAGISASVQTAAYGGNFKDNLKSSLISEGISLVNAQVHEKIGDIGVIKGLNDGGFGKTVIHATAGGALAELAGGDFASGAAAAGAAELASPLIDGIDSKKWRSASAEALGAIAATAAGAEGKDLSVAQGIAKSVHENNRELHREEAEALDQLMEDKTPEEKRQLAAAACALTKCAAGVPKSDPHYERLNTLQAEGEFYQTEQAELSATGYFDYGWLDKVTDFRSLHDETFGRISGALNLVGGSVAAVGSVTTGAALCTTGLGCAGGAFLATSGGAAGFRQAKSGNERLFGDYQGSQGIKVIASFDPLTNNDGVYDLLKQDGVNAALWGVESGIGYLGGKLYNKNILNIDSNSGKLSSNSKSYKRKVDYDNISTAKSSQSIEPRDLNEQILWKSVSESPGSGKPLPLSGDSRFGTGWQKMQKTHKLPDGDHISIHYQYNKNTQKVSDIKIVTPKKNPPQLQPGPSIKSNK